MLIVVGASVAAFGDVGDESTNVEFFSLFTNHQAHSLWLAA
jgi:hypothetical protein